MIYQLVITENIYILKLKVSKIFMYAPIIEKNTLDSLIRTIRVMTLILCSI